MSKRKVCKKDCVGCRNDFYNDKNPLGVKECWSFPAAKLATRFQLSINCPMDRKSGYAKRVVPGCYHTDGYVFLDKIPEHAV